jgi:FMN-dependent NADH-azoreductase
MPRLLRIDSSISPASRTRDICDAYERAWSARGDGHTITRRDLVRSPLPHLTSSALHWPARLRGNAEGAVADPEAEALQQEVIDEVATADVLLVGAPMYNYAMPSQLKVWIDLLHVPGLTAPFDSDTRPFAGKPVVVVTARGAVYDPGTPEEAMDHVLPPIRLVLEDALGMSLTCIATSRTLADVIPDLDPARAADELRDARAAAEQHAASVAVGPAPAEQ